MSEFENSSSNDDDYADNGNYSVGDERGSNLKDLQAEGIYIIDENNDDSTIKGTASSGSLLKKNSTNQQQFQSYQELSRSHGSQVSLTGHINSTISNSSSNNNIYIRSQESLDDLYEDSSVSYFAAFQNQAVRTSNEEVVELAFRIRGLKIHRPSIKKRFSKGTTSNIHQQLSSLASSLTSSSSQSLSSATHQNHQSTTITSSSSSVSQDDDPSVFSPPTKSGHSFFSRTSNRGKDKSKHVSKQKEIPSLIPTLSMIKVFALPNSGGSMESAKFREIHRSEIQTQNESPVYASLSVLPISLELLNSIVDNHYQIDTSAVKEQDLSLKFQLWVSVEHGKLIHFATAYSTITTILRDCGFIPSKDHSRHSINTNGKSQQRRSSAIRMIQNLVHWGRNNDNDSDKSSKIGWCSLNFVPELGNSSNEPVVLDIRVARPSRLLSVYIPQRFDERPMSSASIGPHGNLLRSRPPLPPNMLKGFINAPLSRGFQIPIPDVLSSLDNKVGTGAANAIAAADIAPSSSRFIEFREELAEMPLNLLIPALFIEAAAAQLEVKRMYLQFRFDVEKTEILNNSHFVNHDEFTSLIIKHEKWIASILESLKTRSQKMIASANEYKKLWKKCMGIETLKGHPKAQTPQVSNNGAGITTTASKNLSNASMNQSSNSINKQYDSQFSLFMGSEISSQVSSFNIQHADSTSQIDSVLSGSRDASFLNHIDLGVPVVPVEEDDDDPSPEDAMLIQKILGNNPNDQQTFFRKSVDRKDDKTKYIPVNLHIQILGAREVSVPNARHSGNQNTASKRISSSGIGEWVSNRRDRLSQQLSAINGSNQDGPKDERAMRRDMLIADSVFSASSRRIRGILIDDGNDGSDPAKESSTHGHTPKPVEVEDHTQVGAVSAATEHVYYETITVGAPAAHSMGFKDNHGLKHMEEEFKRVSDEKKKIMSDPASSIAAKLEINRKYVEHDLALSERRHVVYSQALASVSSAVLSKLYVLATTAASLSSGIGMSEKEAFERKEELDALLEQGFLVEWESLLSTAGSELGMLEDTYDAITFISTCVKFRFESIPVHEANGEEENAQKGEKENVDTIAEETESVIISSSEMSDRAHPPTLETIGSMGRTSILSLEFDESSLPIVSARVHRGSYCTNPNDWADSGDIRASSVYWLVTLRLPETIVKKLPNELQTVISNSTNSPIDNYYIKGTNVVNLSKLIEDVAPFPVQCILLTQGINEKQTLINSVHFLAGSTTHLQEQINNEAVRQLNDYCEKRFSKMKPSQVNASDVAATHKAELFNASIHACERLIKAAKSQISTEKNAIILQLTADLVRWLGGLRIISCKSAKDRTSMSITLEEARLLSIWHHMDPNEVQKVANLTREHGVRLINVNKNTGVPKYAFNTVQRRLLPADYRPPLSTIGSFFSRGNVS